MDWWHNLFCFACDSLPDGEYKIISIMEYGYIPARTPTAKIMFRAI